MSDYGVKRWKFEDLVAGHAWVMPVNPNTSSSPFAPKVIAMAAGAGLGSGGLDRPRLFQSPSAPAEMEFGGVIRTKEHHDALHYWARKSNEVRVSDHLGRTFEVIIKQLEITERQTLQTNKWRMTYSMRVLVLRRIT